MKSRTTRYGVLALALVALAGTARGTGTIIMGGEWFIAAGTAPTQGTVTIDECAAAVAMPPVATPPPLGTMAGYTGTMPPAPATGNGSDGDFTAMADVTLAGGTYQFASYAVSNEAVVTYSGSVTILVQGDVTLQGAVRTTAAGADVEIRAGGTVSLEGADRFSTDRRIEAMGAGGDVALHAGYRVRLGTAGVMDAFANVRSALGNVTITAQDDVLVLPCGVAADAGTVVIQAAAEFSMTDAGGYVYGDAGATIQAFDGDFYVHNDTYVASGAGDILLEGTYGVSIRYDSYLSSGSGTIRARAISGDVTFRSNSYAATSGTGGIELEALHYVTITNRSYLSTAQGDVTATAYARQFYLEVSADAGGDGSRSYVSTGGGDVSVRAEENINFGDDARITTGGTGDIELLVAGSVLLTNGDAQGVTLSAGGDLRVRAGADLDFGDNGYRLQGRGVSIATGDEVSGDFDLLRATAGPFDLVAGARVDIGGEIRASGPVKITSLDGRVDITDCRISTDNRTGAASGSILVQAFPGEPDLPAVISLDTIDATDVSIRSGDSDIASGAVTVRFVSGASLPVVESFVLPKKISAKANAGDPSKGRFTAAGFLDTGPDAVDLAGPAVVKVGGITVEAPGFTRDPSGTKFTYSADGLAVTIVASKSGSSRAKFKVAYQGDIAGSFDMENQCTLEFQGDAASGVGTVDLDAGKYMLGRKRGALVAPNLYLAKVKAALKGAGNDSFGLKAGLATDGNTPETVPDVTVGFGDTFRATIPGEGFVRNGDAFTFSGDAGGVTSVVLDYARETLTVKVKGVDLGEFPDGASAVLVTVGLGTDERAVRVRMARKGGTLVY